jgi:energy-coupling factor transporter ATP-binding protein EcfA2
VTKAEGRNEMDRLRIAKLHTWNVGGVEEFEVEPGRVTLLSGGNATGKTSILKALRTIIGGGSEATIKVGADEARAVIVFSDGTEVEARNGGSGWRKRVVPPESGGKTKALAKPQTYLDSLYDSVAFNPIRFAQEATGKADRDARIETLLDMVEVGVTQEEIDAAASGVPKPKKDGRLIVGRAALDEIDRARSRRYDERTGVNRLAKERRSSADEAFRSVPEEPEPIPDLSELRADRDALAADRDSRKARVASAATLKRGTIADEARDRITALEQETARQRAAILGQRAAMLEEATEEERRLADEISAEIDPLVQTLDGDLASGEERIARVASQRAIRDMATRSAVEAGKLELESEALTASIERLDVLRRDLLRNLPVKGLEVRDGDLYLDDVAFDSLNTARRVRIAFEIGAERAKKATLPLMAFDGLEALDEESFSDLVEFLRERPELQVLGASVDGKGGELRAQTLVA